MRKQRPAGRYSRLWSPALPSPPSTGVLLLTGPTLRLLYAHREAIQILTYPEHRRAVSSLERFLAGKIRSLVFDSGPSPQTDSAVEFVSGRRRYVCRAFSVNSYEGNSSGPPAVAVLLERASYDSSRIASQFHLTPREQQTVQFLAQGLTNKEIVSRMGISPHTVKAFLKVAMMKTGSSTPSGIVGKALDALSPGSSSLGFLPLPGPDL